MPRPASAVVTSSLRALVLALRCASRSVSFSLWSFPDKMFGLHYSTGPPRAWINGGIALAQIPDGRDDRQWPPSFESLAMPAMDWLFALAWASAWPSCWHWHAPAAVAGVIMLACCTAAVAPWVCGVLNPVVNEHLVYAPRSHPDSADQRGRYARPGAVVEGPGARQEAALPHLIVLDCLNEAVAVFPVAASLCYGRLGSAGAAPIMGR